MLSSSEPPGSPVISGFSLASPEGVSFEIRLLLDELRLWRKEIRENTHISIEEDLPRCSGLGEVYGYARVFPLV